MERRQRRIPSMHTRYCDRVQEPGFWESDVQWWRSVRLQDQRTGYSVVYELRRDHQERRKFFELWICDLSADFSDSYKRTRSTSSTTATSSPGTASTFSSVWPRAVSCRTWPRVRDWYANSLDRGRCSCRRGMPRHFPRGWRRMLPRRCSVSGSSEVERTLRFVDPKFGSVESLLFLDCIDVLRSMHCIYSGALAGFPFMLTLNSETNSNQVLSRHVRCFTARRIEVKSR